MIKCDNCGFGHKTTKEFDACNTPQAQAKTKHTPGIILRDLSRKENYSGRALKQGEIVYLFSGCTYGCISPGGIAATFSPDGDNPFFEIPEDSVRWVQP